MDEKSKLLKALRDRIRHVSDDCLIELMTANRFSQPGKMGREKLETAALELVNLVDFNHHLPQPIPLTASFIEEVMDPVTGVFVPTGMYRVTMRKLLRLTLSQLQRQAELMKLDIGDADEEGIAKQILINLKSDSPLIRPLVLNLLSKEIARVYGIRFTIPIHGVRHPSSTMSFTLRPIDMIRSLMLTKTDLVLECENQGVPVTETENKERVKETKEQLATRMVAWWTAHPDQLREPFTPAFAAFLAQKAREVGV